MPGDAQESLRLCLEIFKRPCGTCQHFKLTIISPVPILVVLLANKKGNIFLVDILCFPTLVPPGYKDIKHPSWLISCPLSLLNSCLSFRVQPGAIFPALLSLLAHLLCCALSLFPSTKSLPSTTSAEQQGGQLWRELSGLQLGDRLGSL